MAVILIYGGAVESHGCRAVGRDEDGNDGPITLSDEMQRQGCRGDERCEILSCAQDIVMYLE